jgi:uncharacterized protein (TIGR03382 family)
MTAGLSTGDPAPAVAVGALLLLVALKSRRIPVLRATSGLYSLNQ